MAECFATPSIAGEGLDQVERLRPQALAPDLVVGADQFERFALGVEIAIGRLAGGLGAAGLALGPGGGGVHAIEEVGHGDVEDLGELEQTAGADAVEAGFGEKKNGALI